MTSLITWLWPCRMMIGVLLLPCLWGTLGERVGLVLPQAWAQPHNMSETEDHQGRHHFTYPTSGQWEGSPEGIAYSEFNHAFTGLGVLLVGLSELRTAMNWQVMAWFRWVLPASLIGSGIFLLIWSDHEAWPIGSWTLSETLSGKDPEVLQHKLFGILALGVGTVEWFLRSNTLRHLFWHALLPGFAVIGGLMLFLHMHGHHPAGHHIQTHHNVMGTLAFAGGLAWFAGEYLRRTHVSSRIPFPSTSGFILKILWSLFVVVIGLQLILYSET